jgi:AcrR family transcriptional regulator
MSEAKDKILDAASDLFLEGGSAALSVRAIANSAGVSTMGVYTHFNGKEGILDALYIEGFDNVFAAIELPETRLGTRSAVKRTVKNYLSVAENFESHYRLIFGERDADYRPSPEAYEAGARAFHRLTDLVAGLLSPRAPRARQQRAALQLWALVHGLISLRHHAVSDLVDVRDWKQLVLDAVDAHVGAIERKVR